MSRYIQPTRRATEAEIAEFEPYEIEALLALRQYTASVLGRRGVGLMQENAILKKAERHYVLIRKLDEQLVDIFPGVAQYAHNIVWDRIVARHQREYSVPNSEGRLVSDVQAIELPILCSHGDHQHLGPITVFSRDGVDRLARAEILYGFRKVGEAREFIEDRRRIQPTRKSEPSEWFVDYLNWSSGQPRFNGRAYRWYEPVFLNFADMTVIEADIVEAMLNRVQRGVEEKIKRARQYHYFRIDKAAYVPVGEPATALGIAATLGWTQAELALEVSRWRTQ